MGTSAFSEYQTHPETRAESSEDRQDAVDRSVVFCHTGKTLDDTCLFYPDL
jgi:hypothetical protein